MSRLRRTAAIILSIAMVLTGINGLQLYSKAAGEAMGGYLWAFFEAHEGYEKMFFGYSEDGLNWYKLNKDSDGNVQPVLVNNAPGCDKGVRDPHIIRSHDGSKYWILGTDLHAEGDGSGGSGWNQLSASQNIVVWESDDLVNWSEPKLVYAGFDNAGCVWAPEAIYDESAGNYVVYWSSRDKSLNGTEKNALRVYVCRTDDFNTFTTPKVWLSEDEASGKEVNIIDTTIVKEGEYYYRFSTSDWNTIIDRSKTLDTDDVLDVTVDREHSRPNKSWERIVTREGSGAAGFDRREGLTVYRLLDGRWCAMGDSSGYKAFVTDSLASGRFTTEKARFYDGRFRHGTVLRLTKAEEAVFDRYGKPDTSLGALDEAESELPVLEYNFDEKSDKGVMKDSSDVNGVSYNGTLKGNASIAYDADRDSNVLVLDGSDGTYAEFPRGFFDCRNTMTVCMDVKSEMSSGNFFTFTYGKNENVYDFLRIRGSEVRNAITKDSYRSEEEVKGTGAGTGEWQNVAIVIDRFMMRLYINGKLVDENDDTGIPTSSFGTDVEGYLGRSFYASDACFKGCFDNVKIYNRVLSGNEIIAIAGDYAGIVSGVTVGTAPDRQTAIAYRGTDVHSAVYSSINYNNGNITSYVKNGTDIKNVPVTFDVLSDSVTIKCEGESFVNGSEVDLSKSKKFEFTYKDKKEVYTVKHPVMANNSVLPGQYADPDIDYFDGKFWIFPTTDGYPGWSGNKFHAWSSEDMVTWTDEGVIMELANDNPGKNDKGIDIAASSWAVKGSAWAPTIEKKNGKYYFYYCGKDSSGTSQIGVAVADKPEGPYKDSGSPLITVAMCNDNDVEMGQAIDPSVFTDDDGTSYITFGNGKAAIVKLNDDMMSIDKSSLKQIKGLTDFRESVVVLKKDGKYHWTWTCDDANSPNYHVNYGVSDKLDGDIAVIHRPFLQKDESMGILGTGHQSLLHVKDAYGIDRYYVAYHRFYTPVNIFTSGDGLGVHRETCIDEVTFNADGYMNQVHPSHIGVSITMNGNGQGADATPVPSAAPDSSGNTDVTEATQTPSEVKTAAQPPVQSSAPAVTASAAPSASASSSGEVAKVAVQPKPKLKLVSKNSVKRGRKLVVKVKISNPDGSKVKYSLDSNGKKLFKLTKKKAKSVTLAAKKKKGKGKLIVKYGKIKASKTIKVK